VLVVGAEHPLSTRNDLTFDDLKPFGWILPPVETTLRRQLDQYFVRNGHFSPATSVESVSYLTNRALLQNNALIGLMPAHVAAQDLAAGTLTEVPLTLPFGSGSVGVSYRAKTQLSPAGTAFLESLIEVAVRL
jgi:DNA-binding transcriptional LysR family regulator